MLFTIACVLATVVSTVSSVPPVPAPRVPQSTFAFPMQLRPGIGGEPAQLALIPGALDALEPLAQIVLTGAPLSDGTRVDLRLERADADTHDLVLAIDGVSTPGGLAANGSAWAGKVAGEPDSDVFVGFSPFGTRGWIYTHGAYHQLLAGPGPGGDWSHSITLLVGEDELEARGAHAELDCGLDQLSQSPPGPQIIPGMPGSHAPGGIAALTTTTLVCRMAIETDYQLYQDFGSSLTAEQAYLNQLLGAANQRYVGQINTVLNIVYLGLHSSSNDGWTTADGGGNSSAMLAEFKGAWQGSLPNNANLAHFLSGAPLGGGVAYLDELCDSNFGFAVSGNVTLQGGLVPFPIVQGPLTWDFVVFTHETGHNFSTPHTHSFCPTPLDQCAPSNYFGPCQTQQVCISTGTLMSYCHLCSGGMNNIVPFFHQACADMMRAAAEASCIGNWCSGPSTFCTGGINQTGQTGSIAGSGSTSLAANNFTLTANHLPPNKTGFFFYGPDATLVPLGNGFRCVNGTLFRLPVQAINGSGVLTRTLNFTLPPLSTGAGQVNPGTLWRFQAYYRDTGFGLGFNLSNGLAVPFCP